MRVLVVNYEYPPIGGGGGFVTRDILEEIVKHGHDVTVVTSHFKELEKREQVNGVEIVRVPVFFRKEIEVANMPSMFTYFPSSVVSVLSDKTRRRKYDIINTHFAVPSGPAGHLISKLLNSPNVLSIHGGDIFDPSKTLSPHKTPVVSSVVEFMLNRADRVVAQSSDTRKNAYRYYRVGRDIEIIPLGIKKPSYSRATRKDFGFSQDDFLLCTIGRLVKRKNLSEFVEILAGIRNQQNLKLIIIGDGPERIALENSARQNGISDKVYFFGSVSDLAKFQLLDISDVYVSTALHEGFGLVFLEAMECGLPVVCYDRGGQTDFLINEKTGFLVEFGNTVSFTERILEIYSNEGLRDKIRTFNKNLIKDYYISSCAQKYVSLFDSVIREHREAKRKAYLS
jgi:glycosyltransferase involved in cell wall biosynthesis